MHVIHQRYMHVIQLVSGKTKPGLKDQTGRPQLNYEQNQIIPVSLVDDTVGAAMAMSCQFRISS